MCLYFWHRKKIATCTLLHNIHRTHPEPIAKKSRVIWERNGELKMALLKSGADDCCGMKSWQIDPLFIIPLWTRRGVEIAHRCSLELLLASRQTAVSSRFRALKDEGIIILLKPWLGHSKRAVDLHASFYNRFWILLVSCISILGTFELTS